jgi:hypothetical protein
VKIDPLLQFSALWLVPTPCSLIKATPYYPMWF